ncbi:ATP-binding protein [Sphingobacterium sp. DN00404]|uniref:ATP-binding protein n=1 Tax=Sphingobacterium micropteri TaxID=2763501 RepID=A0ABR7YVB7_9SPHI|nr:ATP-binding protein [Sphingobacterium micropteri]MBD1435181.1 ATP-binding protein [Sphingobacterium micropteri]
MQFRTKARAVDLLGKGQIADLPTAITELWKNGYDAYADNLTAEVFKAQYRNLSNSIFLITDDGKGMSRNDILEKWLVLGTDSKSRAELEQLEDQETLWKKPRIKAGEKGIGRLSVAYLGYPMLMITKKIGYPVQLLFFDWRLLENFNLFLDDIYIPVEDLTSVSEVREAFYKLKISFLQNFRKREDRDGNLIWEDKQMGLREDILRSAFNARLTDDVIDTVFSDLVDLRDSHGTKFLIFEPIDQILELAEENKDEDTRESREFTISSLSGFVNPFKENNQLVTTSFYIHEFLGQDKELINGEGKFFTAEDYKSADVLIDGKFDGNGNFKGDLKIYDKLIPYEYKTTRRKFAKKFYGEIPIKLGYSQGDRKDSMLSDNAFKKINDKVTKNGGLYIFRDEFRVLPYGRPNADFLKFEERRNKRIGTYYFSYRRMFGYLELSRGGNPYLKDKSSREGLISNDPYRAFEADLIAFFIQVAKDFFSDKAEQSIFLDQKKMLNQRNKAIESDRKRETEEKKAFSRSLNAYPNKFKIYEKEYSSLLALLEQKIQKNNVAFSEIEIVLERLHQLDVEFEKLLPAIPTSFEATDLQLDRLNKYEDQIRSFNNSLKKNSAVLMTKVAEIAELRDLKINFTKNIDVYKGELEAIIYENFEVLKTKVTLLLDEYNQRANSILTGFEEAKKNALGLAFSKDDIQKQSEGIKREFEDLKKVLNETLIPLVNHVNRMSFDIDEELLQGAYKAEYNRMRDQWNQVQYTAQLGIAVEIIDHEFNVLYSRISRLLHKLDKENEIAENSDYKLLEKTFRSLEDKYDLLSPLYKINSAVSKDIRCSEVITYIKDFFDIKLKEEEVKIVVSDSFQHHIIRVKEPILYTVLINIMNNAFFWMKNSEIKEIHFDYLREEKEILILNSGQKIEEHRLSKIFELFYSNRPTGRGIGLYLAKESLLEAGFDIYATNDSSYNTLDGACFVIKPNL